MATVSDQARNAPAGESLMVADWESRDFLDPRVDAYLGQRLRAVGEDHRQVAVLTFCLAAVLGMLGWFVVGVLLDHWVVPGGLSTVMRVVWLAGALIGVTAAAARWLAPFLWRRVNLVYAARTLERADPSLRNDLVNAVLVRSRAVPAVRPDAVERRTVGMEVVVRSLEKRAAKRLAKMPEDVVADRGPAVRLAAAVAILLGLACLYELLSPKSLVSSFSRIAAPLASIAPPTRVRFERIECFERLPPTPQGGAADGGRERPVDPVEARGRAGGPPDGPRERVVELVRGRQLVVRAAISGLSGQDRARCEVTPLVDGRPAAADSWQVDLRRVESATRSGGGGDGGGRFTHEAVLPAPLRGVDRPLRVVPLAGDARGEPLLVEPADAPQMLVREMRLVFPDYTRRATETLEWQGDIRGVEGTVVMITAEANRPLESAWIDLGNDGQTDIRLDVDGEDPRIARGRMTLLLNRERAGPWFDSYRLSFLPRDGDGSRQRGLPHRIAVSADLEPEIVVEQPASADWTVAADLPVSIAIRAVDPDFGLSRVTVETRLDEAAPARPIVLLDDRHQGPFRGTARFVPSALGAAAGQTVEYRGVAADVRQLRDLGPNVVATPWRKLRVADSAAAARPPAGGGEESSGGPSEGRPAGGDPGSDGPDNPAEGPPKKGMDGAADVRPREDGGAAEADGRPRDEARGEQQKAPRDGADAGPDRGDPADGQKGGMSQSARESAAGSQRSGDSPTGADGADQRRSAQGADDAAAGDGSRTGDKPESAPEKNAAAGEEPRQPGRATEQGSGAEGGRPEGERAAGGERGGRRDRSEGGSGQASRREDPLASDGTDDGEAVERILDHRRRNAAENQRPGDEAASRRPGEPGESAASQAGGQPRPDQGNRDGAQPPRREEQQSARRQNQSSNPPQEPQEDESVCKDCQGRSGGCKNCSGGGAGGGSGGEQAGGEKAGGEKAGGEKAGGEQAGGEKAGGEKAGGEKAGGEKAGGEQAGGEKAGGEKAGGEKAGGEKAGGEKAGSGAGGKGEQDARAGEESGQPGGAGGSENGTEGLGGVDGGRKGPPPEGGEPTGGSEWADASTEHARNAVDLALAHLRDAVQSGDGEVLDELGWTRQDAENFLARWESLARQAGAGDPRKEVELDHAVRSLGLKPGAVSRRSKAGDAARGGQHEGRRSRPPVEYGEQFKAYSQGALGQP
jgi:hypothetical protein